MNIHSRLCDDIATWQRRNEDYQREADILLRAGDEQGAAIYRQGVVSIAAWLDRLVEKRKEIERIAGDQHGPQR